jgi:hypothetical protein
MFVSHSNDAMWGCGEDDSVKLQIKEETNYLLLGE